MAEPKKKPSKKDEPDDDGKFVIDVKRPGKSAPSPTSKSVIVGNRPILKDPMISSAPPVDSGKSMAPSKVEATGNEPASEEPGEPKEKVVSLGEKKLEPITSETSETSEPAPAPEAAASEASEPAPEPEKTAVEEEDKPAITSTETVEKSDETAEKSKATSEKSDGTLEKSETGETDKSEKSTDQPNDAEVVEAQASQEAAEHEAAVVALAESKKYFLPVNAVEKRRAQQFVILGVLVSILLAAAWVDVALDAGLIQINGVKPVTHFFSN